jgi:D-cysteine desulfhydrase
VTYSGKALAGLRALIAEPRYRGKVFLLWNTLSTPRPSVDAGTAVPASLGWMLEKTPVA